MKMKKRERIKNFIFNSKLSHLLPDSLYLKLLYRYKIGHKLDLLNPLAYTEKLQWLKLYNRNDIYTSLVDKYDVREYVSKTIGEEFLIPLCGGPWNSFSEIDFGSLPNQFVLKTTHDSGGVYICKCKNKLDINEAKGVITNSQKHNFYWRYREWPYKNIKPRIIAEKYMVDESGYELKDYKFFIFHGSVKALFVATNRLAKTETCFDFFDKDFNHLPIKNGHPNSSVTIKKPDNYVKMVQIAERLGAVFPHVRVDLYNINGSIYFGEMTFYHFSGLTKFEPDNWDYIFGEWLDLTGVKKQNEGNK